MENTAAKLTKDDRGIALDINGQLFTVDVKYGLLIDRSDPLNSISFHDMFDKGSHYEFPFDPVEKNITAPWEPGSMTVNVPQQVAIDPAGMAAKYGIAENLLTGTDAELNGDPKWLQDRLDGHLPKIDIAGKDYFVDLHLNELRSTANHDDKIDLDKLVTTYDGRYISFYHTDAEKFVQLKGDITQVPEHVKMILIPAPISLDPVSVARSYDMDERSFQKEFPMMARHEARSYLLSETGIPALAARNKQKAELDMKDQQKATPPKRKRGHRL